MGSIRVSYLTTLIVSRYLLYFEDIYGPSCPSVGANCQIGVNVALVLF